MVAREPAGVGGSPHNGRASAEVRLKPPTSGGMVTQWSLSPSRIRLYRSPMDEPAVRAGVRAAFDKLRAAYRELGGWRFPGYLDDPTMAYVGPWAWSEGDIQRHFANALAEEFPPEWVHVELPLRIGTRSDLPAQEQGAVRFARRNVPFFRGAACRHQSCCPQRLAAKDAAAAPSPAPTATPTPMPVSPSRSTPVSAPSPAPTAMPSPIQ
jgi:cell division septation protein DedD